MSISWLPGRSDEGHGQQIRRTPQDTAAWLLGAGVLVALLPVGWVPGDTLVHANRFAYGGWWVNPNHLLMEPVAVLLYGAAEALGVGATPPDRLMFVSAWVGAASLGLYRALLAPALTDSRIRRNVSTLVFAGGWTFLAIWVSGKPHLLQLPFLVLAAWTTLRYIQSPSRGRALAAGLAYGFASLAFASAAVLGGATALALLAWRVVRVGFATALDETAVLLLSATAVGLLGAAVGWAVVGPEQDLLAWVTSYGGQVDVFENPFYGVETLSLRGLAAPLVRSLYGSVRAAVDLSPLVAFVRGRPVSTFVVAGSVGAGLLAAWLCGWRLFVGALGGDSRSRTSAIVTVAWLTGTILFGTFFNTAENHFYVQLAVPLAMLAAAPTLPSATGRRVWWAGAILVLAWNVGYVTETRVLYPRQERLAELERGVRGGDLVVYPGHDETNTLLVLLPDTLYREGLSLITMSRSHGPKRGLEALADSVCQSLRQGGSVRVVGVFDAHPDQRPWRQLRRRGFGRDRVVTALDRFRVTRVGGEPGVFGIRELTASPAMRRSGRCTP